MNNYIVRAENVGFTYKQHNDNDDVIALEEVSAKIEKGQFVVIIGRNGSGKSTFARLLNALLIPDKGIVYIDGMDTKDSGMLWNIRKTAGMIFQNPDNQIVGTTVEEDVAFAPENLGVPPESIRRIVDESLKTVGIQEYAKHSPALLSGGQKQRVAIAGILAMKPECIILDESTAMLDPIGRKEVMQVMRKLNKEENKTVIHITHHMDEAALADRVIVIDKGRLVFDAKPSVVFSQVERIKEIGLDVPQVTELFHKLNQEGYEFPLDIISVDDAAEVLVSYIKSKDN